MLARPRNFARDFWRENQDPQDVRNEDTFFVWQEDIQGLEMMVTTWDRKTDVSGAAGNCDIFASVVFKWVEDSDF